MRTIAKVELEISGIGFIIYSPFAVAHIGEGENYLEAHYWEPDDVVRHISAGTIAGFCTGSPGTYELELVEGKPATPLMVQYTWWIRLALQVKDGTFCIRDLYDLSRWRSACPPAQKFPIADGNYRLTIGSRESDSGVVGDHQEIVVCFEAVPDLPTLKWDGVPFLGEG